SPEIVMPNEAGYLFSRYAQFLRHLIQTQAFNLIQVPRPVLKRFLHCRVISFPDVMTQFTVAMVTSPFRLLSWPIGSKRMTIKPSQPYLVFYHPYSVTRYQQNQLL